MSHSHVSRRSSTCKSAGASQILGIGQDSAFEGELHHPDPRWSLVRWYTHLALCSNTAGGVRAARRVLHPFARALNPGDASRGASNRATERNGTQSNEICTHASIDSPGSMEIEQADEPPGLDRPRPPAASPNRVAARAASSSLLVVPLPQPAAV